MKTKMLAVMFMVAIGLLAKDVGAQGRPDPAKLVAAQQQAMQKLSFLDGVWRGPAWTLLATGAKHSVTQTERVGSMLDGGVKVIEGRAYEVDGKPSFNAFGIISFNPMTNSYSMRSYAQGFVGDYAVTVNESGFSWEIPAGPITMRYTATVKDGVWTEFGDRILPNKEVVRFFEMELKRVGDSTWPSAGAVSPK